MRNFTQYTDIETDDKYDDYIIHYLKHLYHSMKHKDLRLDSENFATLVKL